MKKIKFLALTLLTALAFTSCEVNQILFDESEDTLTGDAYLGSLVSLDNSGKLLGIPSSQDFDTATVTFTETELDLTVNLASGGQDIQSYEIVKSLNGGSEVTVAQGTSLPLSVNYSSVEEYTEGLGVSPTDLRIGDQIVFRTKMVHEDGTVLYGGPSNGTYTITVNCSSALAQRYDVSIRYIRTSSGIDTSYDFEETFTETAPGEYRTAEVGPWIDFLGLGLGVGTPGFTFTDTCGQITVPDQFLLDYYSNIVSGSGSVNGETGVITIDYTICASDCREVYAVYTPQN